MTFVLAIDQGTTGSTALVLSRQGEVVGRAYSEFTQHYPRPGWVEHDAEEIWQVSLKVMAQALSEATLHNGSEQLELAAIGIANQRETTVIWDRKTGLPVNRAIVWQSRQSAPICERLRAEGHEALFKARTGLIVDAYFSATKIRWILDQDPQLQRRAEAGELAFGTIDSWLLWKLTGGTNKAGAVHFTEPTNASRTLIYNINDHCWDVELCRLLDIPVSMLPEVKPSAGIFGTTVAFEGIPSGIPIAGMAGDQQAALFGQTCWSAGQAKNTYGTGCFLLMNMGKERPTSEHGLLTTICCDANGEPAYALEGSVFSAGATIQWLRDELGLITDAAETEGLASQLQDNEGVYLVPAFTGLGAPWWDMDARAAIVGLTRGAGRAHFARAALESIAFQTNNIVAAMNKDSGISLTELRVDGGASGNDFLMQFQADILDVAVERPKMIESTAAGCAYLAGLAVGMWDNPEELSAIVGCERRFEPQMDSTERERLCEGWLQAVARVRSGKKESGQVAQSGSEHSGLVGVHQSETVCTPDGLRLFVRSWVPASCLGTVVLVHGLAEHSGRYAETAKYLTEQGWAVYAMDLRGHGLSSDGHKPGRVHINEFSDYATDVDCVFAMASKRHPGLRRVILGHSMGGLISMTYALDHPDSLDGAIISSPALATHPEFEPPAVLKLLVGFLSRIAPRMKFKSELDVNAISRDLGVVEAYINDPLVTDKVSARWYASMMKAMENINERAVSLRVPMLLMQSGADRLVDPSAATRWASQAPEGMLELVVWDDLYHEMLNEPEKDRVRVRISEWLQNISS